MLQVTRASEGVPTGVAQICVGTESGANSIVIVQGANGAVSPDDVYAAHSLFSSAKVIADVLYMHLPLPSFVFAMQCAVRSLYTSKWCSKAVQHKHWKRSS
jgi:sugar/nucleoside kinase (ribokinase family)